MSTIFLSYRRGDAADAAGRINDRLVRQFGDDAVYMDVESIPLGEDFVRHIETHVQECLVMVVVIGPHWIGRSGNGHESRIKNSDDFVRTELELGLKYGLAIMPLLVSGASMPTRDQLPPSLQWLPRRNAFPVGPNPNFHRDMDRVIAAVEVRRAKIEEERSRRDEEQRQVRERPLARTSSSDLSAAPSRSTPGGMIARLLPIAANVEKYQLVGIMRIFRRAPIAFLIVGLIAAAASEGLAARSTGTFPPTWLADSSAAVIGVAVGGAAALIVAFQQLFVMIIQAIELTVAEAERVVAEGEGLPEERARPALVGVAELPSSSEYPDHAHVHDGGGVDAAVPPEPTASSASVTSVLGFVSKYALNAITRTFRGSFVAFVLVGLLAATAAEIVAAYSTATFPPMWLTNVAASVIGVSVGGVVALVIALSSFFEAVIRAIELLVREAEQLAVEERSELVSHGAEESRAPDQLMAERASGSPDVTGTA